jgi:hypothetical protein
MIDFEEQCCWKMPILESPKNDQQNGQTHLLYHYGPAGKPDF